MITMPREAQLPSERIATDMISAIRAGVLRPGDQLPTVARICDDYSVSRVTALKAMTKLREDGWIKTIPRWGNFVADEPPI